MGWNLGKKNKSIHLFDPLTSTPIMGTKSKVTKVIKTITNRENPKRKKMLIPDVKIKTAHEKITNRVWPISGCLIKSKEIIDIKIIDNKYFK